MRVEGRVAFLLYGVARGGVPAGAGAAEPAPDTPRALSGTTAPEVAAAEAAKKLEKGLPGADGADAGGGEGAVGAAPPLAGLPPLPPPLAGSRGTPASASSLRSASPVRCWLAGSAAPCAGTPEVPNCTPVVTTPVTPACVMASLRGARQGEGEGRGAKKRRVRNAGVGMGALLDRSAARTTECPAPPPQPPTHLATSSWPLSEVRRRSKGASGRPLSSHLDPVSGRQGEAGREGCARWASGAWEQARPFLIPHAARSKAAASRTPAVGQPRPRGPSQAQAVALRQGSRPGCM